VRRTLLLPAEELRGELLRVTDWFTGDLFALPPHAAATVRFPVSRLVVDPERFVDDEREAMASRGAGVIYTRTSDGRPLRRSPSPVEREALLGRFYEPHHEALASAIDGALGRRDRALVLDCHSFPSRPLPWEFDQSADRPDVCLGTDPFHTPACLLDEARERFAVAGFAVAIDRPFAGALVPASHAGLDARVLALMLEINRRLYMDEESGDRLPGFDALAAIIQEIVAALADAVERR
jgi:N-formylglutamate amidohydrolase